MSDVIYDKLVYGRDLTPEQWSKLQYRPLDDTDMYGIAENPSFGIDKSLIGGGNYMEMFYHNEDLGNINILCALFNIEAEHEEHQYLVEDEHPEQVYENTDEAQIPYLFIGPNYTGQDTPTATLSADDWNDLISGRPVQFGYNPTSENFMPSVQDGAGVFDIEYGVDEEAQICGFQVDTDNTELINALNSNGVRISGTDFTLDNLSVTRPATFDTANFTKISFSKMAPSIFEGENFYPYIKEPFNIDNGENDYLIYANIGKDYLVVADLFAKFYTNLKIYSTPNVEVSPYYVGMGTVSVSPQKSSYEALSDITMTATPNEGYMFNEWTCGVYVINEENPHTDRVGPIYYALFGRPITITLVAEPAEGGTVAGEGTYAEGSNITISATPNEGYEFLGWWEGEDQRTGSDAAEWNIKVGSEDTTYTAKFSSLEDRKIIYTTNSDAGEIQWIAENCEEGTYTHDENGGTAILRSDVDTIYGLGDNEKLTSINIPNSLTSIVDGAFANCTSLASIDLPNSLTSIGNNAFYNCTSLANVYCYIETTDVISSIGANVPSIFDNIAANPTLHVPASVLTEYQNPEYKYVDVFSENIVAITE